MKEISELNALYERAREDDYQFVPADATLHRELYYKILEAAIADSIPMTMIQTEKLNKYNMILGMYKGAEGDEWHDANEAIKFAQYELMRSLGVDTRAYD